MTERLERAAVLDLAGAAFHPPFGAAATLLEPVDPLLGRATRLGPAFLAVRGEKPPA